MFNKTWQLSCSTTKSNKITCALVKTQISLGCCSVWLESLLCDVWVANDPFLLQADSKDSDQSWQMPMLICVFTGCTGHFVGFCCAPAKLFSLAPNTSDSDITNSKQKTRIKAFNLFKWKLHLKVISDSIYTTLVTTLIEKQYTPLNIHVIQYLNWAMS